MKLQVVTCSAIFAAAASLAVDTAYWTGGSGDFSGGGHWENGISPTASHAIAFRPAEHASVKIDGSYTILYWTLMERSLELGPTAIELTGPGSLTSTSSTSSMVNPGRNLVVNGADVTIDKNLVVTNSTLSVKSGSLTVKGETHLRAGTLVLEGGSCSSKFVTSDNSTVRFAGGRLAWAVEFDPDTCGKFLPMGESAVLDILDKEEKALCIRTAGSRTFGGTIVITNRSASVPHPGVLVYRQNCEFSDGGILVADALRIDTGKTLTCRLKALKLGYGLRESSTTAATYSFPDGILFGAWGDWSNAPGDASAVDVSLAGDIVFDTLDCFNGITTRSISLAGVADAGIKSISARGGGTATLGIPSGFSAVLDGIEVGEGTTLDLSGVIGAIRVRNLTLCAGAVLRLDAAKNSVEVLGAQAVDSTARIEVAVSAEPAAGSLAPVFDSLSPLPAAALSCEAPSGWSVESLGGCAYLSDGTTPAFPYDSSVYAWLGTQSSSWSDAGNWTKEDVPRGSVNVFFARVANSSVVYDWSVQYPGQLNYLSFHSSCGPFVVSGQELKPKYGSATSQSVISDSNYPVVISNFMACASDPGGSIMHRANSYIALVGGGSSKGSLRVRGDIRLGGEWSATNVIESVQTTAGARATQLTILAGGTLTMDSAGEPVAPPAGVRIDGRLVLGGGVAGLNGIAWTGTGSVEMTGDSAFGEDQTLALGDSLTLFPQTDWRTVSAVEPGVVSRISASGSPTLGATCSWTYGPEPGVAALTTPGARALTVASGATLTIDTEDPATHQGRAITFADPISGGGNVVKTGAGTLVFETGDSQIGGTFSVVGGTVAPGPALMESAGWIRLVVASGFSGIDGAVGDMKWRVVDAGEGLLALEVRPQAGLVVIVQ